MFKKFVDINMRGTRQDPKSDGKKSHQCIRCKKTFSKIQGLSKHKRICWPEKKTPETCPTCKKNFNRKDNLKAHMLSCKGPKNTNCACQVCGKVFRHEYYVKRHMTVHSSKENKLKVVVKKKSTSKKEIRKMNDLANFESKWDEVSEIRYTLFLLEQLYKNIRLRIGEENNGKNMYSGNQ